MNFDSYVKNKNINKITKIDNKYVSSLDPINDSRSNQALHAFQNANIQCTGNVNKGASKYICTNESRLAMNSETAK